MQNEKIPKIAYSVNEAAEALGINISYMYDLVRQESFPSFKIGNRFFVSVKGLEEWVLKKATCGAEN